MLATKGFLLMCVLALGQSDNCPNRLALNLVDVWVHRDHFMRAETLKDINFHKLDLYKTIDVTRANVTVLCEGMIKNFPRLERLSLINVNLTTLQSGAFEAVPRLNNLALSDNHLTSLNRDQFKSLKPLQTLYLSSNEIEHIDDDTFADLPNLKKVHLDRNLIFSVNGAWFLHQAQISVIDLSYNRISKLQSKAFTLPPNSVVKIKLQHNIIEELEPRVAVAAVGTGADHLPYLTLHLERNNLREISAGFAVSMKDLISNLIINSNYIECIDDDILNEVKMTSALNLHLHNNPLSCDCMEKISKFLEAARELRGTLYYNSTLECELHKFQAPGWYYTR